MSGLVPGLTLWRTRVRHETAAAEAFRTTFALKQQQRATRPQPFSVPDATYRQAMGTVASFREEIRALQMSQMQPFPAHGPRGLPDVPKVGGFTR